VVNARLTVRDLLFQSLHQPLGDLAQEDTGLGGRVEKRRLGVGFGETTPDGRFTLKEYECMGACGDAPVLLLNNRKMLPGMTPEKIDEMLKELGQ